MPWPWSRRNSLAVASSSSIAPTAASRLLPGDHRAVIGEQHRRVIRRRPGAPPRPAGCRRAGIRHERQLADPHHVVGRERRQHVVRVQPGEARDRDRVGRVQVHDRPRVGRISYTHWCKNASFEGASPPTWRPSRSSLAMRAGSSRPRRELVGVTRKPSSSRTLMLPVAPCARPRPVSSSPKAAMSSRRPLSLTARTRRL